MLQNKAIQRIGLIIITVVFVSCFSLYIKHVNTEAFTCGPSIVDPKTRFTELTNIEWPQNTEIITSAHQYRGLHCDGAFYVMFKTDQKTLEDWLNKIPALEYG